ncbi:hypothetical protein [Catenuloplanes indicus]|uniref:Uncharacterized protein n=1 Tax=Catenuloplanes indicus TaxID=137267 RepID=A0AAE4B0U4_9ACTN|nr:hypothetical protein [Catenuloplanes indicus]MDQ0370710.1 hypothetical protein [Catenuloplanes indicus]
MRPSEAGTGEPVREGEVVGELTIIRAAAPRAGLIEFLDNRWRFAETSDANAKRAILILISTLVSVALALIMLLALLTGVGMLLVAFAGHVPAALLALVPLLGAGTGVVAVNVYRRRG